MEQTNVYHFNELLRERTMKMAMDVRNILNNVHVNPIDRPIVNQLIRSSSSVAANYRSATRGRSDAEYYSKICIVVEEVDETLFWIEFLIRLKILDEAALKHLTDELIQLIRLFATIKRRMKEKLESLSHF